MLQFDRCFVGTIGSSTSFLFAGKILVYPVVELQPIIGYNRLGYFEPTHNVLPYELNNIFIFDGCKGFDFYPFTEIVGGNR